MAKAIVMPALGMAQDTGTLLRWFKAPGDPVTKGEVLMEIETDKATVEIEAAASGVLAGVSAQPGDVVPVGQTVGWILAPGEGAPAPAEETATPAKAKPGVPSGQPPATPATARPLASPKARRMAREQGVDLAAQTGSGPGGAVVAADLQATPVEGPVAPGRIWKVMAQRMTQAWTTIPHFYIQREVDAAALARRYERAEREGAEKVTYTDLLVALVARALIRHPRLNATWREGSIVLQPEVNIGLAVAVEDGLVVPVLQGADRLSLTEISRRRAELVKRAQSGRFRPEDLQNGTFTITNLGMFGVEVFQAIINPPQAAILAVGSIVDRVVPVEGRPIIQPRLTLALSCDHRVVDGVGAARFLQTLAELIASPAEPPEVG